VRLARQGVPVAASVQGWPRFDRRISELSRVGVDLRARPAKPSLIGLARRYISGKGQLAVDFEQSFGNLLPSLVVISEGSAFPPSYRKVLGSARRYFFVSEANWALAEKQLGHAFDNAEIVRNPLTIDIDSSIPWPPTTSEQELCMACVGRLTPDAKGQDILLEVLARPCWRDRQWRLTFYGGGRSRQGLECLVERLKLKDRVVFAGHVAVEKIWRDNHVLVMASRYEGLPLSIVEAMLSGRPVVVTNVGGNSEIVRDGITGFLAEAAVGECFSRALERMWEQREKLQQMGNLAATAIREIMPDDPVEVFAEKLKYVANVQGQRDFSDPIEPLMSK